MYSRALCEFCLKSYKFTTSRQLLSKLQYQLYSEFSSLVISVFGASQFRVHCPLHTLLHRLVVSALLFAMPEAAELVAAADTLSEAKLYTEAINTYTKAIELAPNSPPYFIKRYCQPVFLD